MNTLLGRGRRFLAMVRQAGPGWAASQALAQVGFPTLGWWPRRSVEPEALSEQIVAILRAWGMTEEHIPVTTEYLLYADLHGIDSHGVGMLRHYHRRLKAGALVMTPKIAVIRESKTTALLDGGGGLGHFPGDRAMKMAIAKCRETGLGAVTVRNSGHFGAAGAYAALAAQSGCLGIATTNTESPALVPTFGRDAMLGTNPLAFAAPAGRNHPFLLDMSTSTVPVGRLVEAWRSGLSIPAGWAADPGGRPVTNARLAAKHRRLSPLGGTGQIQGGHKGYGLAAMVQVLSGLLSGTPSGRVGHFFLAIDPRHFRADGEFEANLDEMMDALRASPPAESNRPVLVAGDPEYAACAERRQSGVPLTRAAFEEIRAVCHASGAEFLLEGDGPRTGIDRKGRTPDA